MRMERFLNFDVFLSDEAMPHGVHSVEHLRECHGHLVSNSNSGGQDCDLKAVKLTW